MRKVLLAVSGSVLLCGAILAGSATAGHRIYVCPRVGPRRVSANSWPKAKRRMAPRGAQVINLCRYRVDRYGNPGSLAGNDMVATQPTKRQLISKFDALKQLRGVRSPLRCPREDGKEILANLYYRKHRRVQILVALTGCQPVTNGNVHRLAVNVDGKNPAGPRLITQLKRLTSHQRTYH
jgi:hypothetical protein